MILLRRSSMSQIMSEGLLYLKENLHLWSIKDVAEALQRVKEHLKKIGTAKKMKAHQEEETIIAATDIGAALDSLTISDVIDYRLELKGDVLQGGL